MLANVKKVIKENETVKTFVLEPEEKKDFIPGQFLMVHKDLETENGERRTGRAYSIASSPEEELKITVKLYEDGKISSYLWSVKEGDDIEIQYPFGHFKLEDEEKLVFVSGGTGIAPIRSMVLDCINKGKDFKMISSFRTEDDFIYKDELDGWNCEKIVTSERGRITKDDLGKFDKDSVFYICGSPEMATNIENILGEIGIPEENVRTEKW